MVLLVVSAVAPLATLSAGASTVPPAPSSAAGTHATPDAAAGAAPLDALDASAETSAASRSRGEVDSMGAMPAASRTNATTPHDGLHVDFTTSLTPARPGEVGVVARFTVPSGVTSITAEVPEGATVTDTEGFSQRGPRRYEWTRTTDTPSLTYRWSVNESVTRGREGAETSGHLFVDTGEWALTRAPRLGVTYSGTGERQPIRTDQSVDGQGVAGESLLFLGPVDTTTRTVDGQQVTLAVPAAAELRESRADVLDTLARAARTTTLGPTDERALVIVAPTDGVQYGSTGLQRGPADFWVRDVQRLDSPENVWVHEYVHTRQTARPTSATRWSYEGMADYYAASQALHSGRINYSQFRRHLDVGTRPRYGDVVLAEPETWRGTTANYWKGALVFAAIDRQIRIESDGSATLQDAMRRAQERSDGGRLTQSTFLDSVAAVGGPESRRAARRFTETEATPETWNRSEHARVFGGLPDVEYRFEAFRVEGPYRTTTSDRLPTLATDERVVVLAVAANTGDAPGTYAATLRSGERAIGTRSGKLAPGESTTLSWTVPFEAPGNTTLRLGESTRRVTVRSPAEPGITDLQVPGTVRTGERVRVRAVVENPADHPAGGAITLTAAGRQLTERDVRLAPGESVTLSQQVVFQSAGEYPVSVGDRTTRVTVREATPTPTRVSGGGAGDRSTTAATDGGDESDGGDTSNDESGTGSPSASATGGTPTDADGAGFGLVAALLGVAAALALAVRRN
ncbi:hypothetical protein BRC89_13570 [Halobacteriales archaeon QS_4_70_19]|nr:MAG: hypothetical protein BRC89_13570 [Halobacteriales archaeon QS_4_70_19]